MIYEEDYRKTKILLDQEEAIDQEEVEVEETVHPPDLHPEQEEEQVCSYAGIVMYQDTLNQSVEKEKEKEEHGWKDPRQSTWWKFIHQKMRNIHHLYQNCLKVYKDI